MPHEGTTQTRYRIIGKDNSRYLTFHNGGNFNIGCNVNTTIQEARSKLDFKMIDNVILAI